MIITFIDIYQIKTVLSISYNNSKLVVCVYYLYFKNQDIPLIHPDFQFLSLIYEDSPLLRNLTPFIYFY